MTDTLDAMKQRARDCFKAFATQDKARLEANVAPTYIRQDTTLPFEVKGPEGVLALGDVLPGAFSEVEPDIQEVIAEGDKVLVHLRFRGLHSGPFGDYPASNKRFDVMVLDFFSHGKRPDRRTMARHRQSGSAAADRDAVRQGWRKGRPVETR